MMNPFRSCLRAGLASSLTWAVTGIASASEPPLQVGLSHPSLYAAVAAANSKQPAPAFQGERLREPPQQNAPWNPPQVDLPETLISATEVLFRQGLADPRGGEYRELEVGVGHVWSGGGGVVASRGWVLPGDDGDRRFAVCWNGLVYPVVSVGEPADFPSDVRELIRVDEESRRRYQERHPDSTFNRLLHSIPEVVAVSHESMLPIKVCLLLRIGEDDLAKDLWEAWAAGKPPRWSNNEETLRDPYLAFASDWAWMLFDRAVCAHQRGDDRLALPTAELLASVRPKIEAEAARRGFRRPLPQREGEVRPYVTFLYPLDRLLEDQRRRARQPRIERVFPTDGERATIPFGHYVEQPEVRAALLEGAERFPDQDERIAALIRDLEEVLARQWGQPGGVVLDEDLIIVALIEEGDAAVGPLIDCLESDSRLTRTVQFHRDFGHHREIKSVDAAAYVALTKILDTRQIGPRTSAGYHGSTDPERRKAVAEEIRSLWQETRNAGHEERWYRLLADDRGNWRQWVEAADRIVRPVRGHPDAEAPRPLQGEPLRAKTDPSVTELMIRRTEALSSSGAPGSERTFNLHNACNIALSLGSWDSEAALPTLRMLISGCREELATSPQAGSWTIQILGRYIARMTLAAGAAGDEDLPTEYAAWIRTVSPDAFGVYAEDLLEPLWKHADHPAIADAADWLLDDEDSPWSLLREALSGQAGPSFERLFRTPLISLPGMQRQLLRELENRQTIGSVQVSDEGRVWIRTQHRRQSTTMRSRDDFIQQ